VNGARLHFDVESIKIFLLFTECIGGGATSPMRFADIEGSLKDRGSLLYGHWHFLSYWSYPPLHWLPASTTKSIIVVYVSRRLQFVTRGREFHWPTLTGSCFGASTGTSIFLGTGLFTGSATPIRFVFPVSILLSCLVPVVFRRVHFYWLFHVNRNVVHLQLFY
jgi:hypothetical protein